MSQISKRLETVHQRINQAALQAGRQPTDISLLAVSKTQPIEQILAAIEAGQRAFGESYAQEAIAKIEAINRPDIEWHFIGPIQSNKTAVIAQYFDWVHSVDRNKIARRLSSQRPKQLPALNICIQVNISGEKQKAGIAPEQIVDLVEHIRELPGLRLRGLMAIPANTTNAKLQAQAFAELQQLFAHLNEAGYQLDTLSMGMSHDLEVAIAQGATLVRIGTAIFGPRKQVTD